MVKRVMTVTNEHSDAVQLLINLKAETVSAALLAPVVKMHPSVIIEYAKTGKWDLCKYVISGNRVKFFRLDFLQKMGFLQEDPPEKDLMTMILEELKAIREMIANLKPAGSSH